MPIDEISEGLIRGIGRFVWYALSEIFFEITCYPAGKLILRIITLGKYPPQKGSSHSESFVSFIGLLGVFAVIVCAFVVYRLNIP